MDALPFHLTSTELIARLACAFVAAAILGFDRGEHGHTVGLRTTLLVALAACVSMLQANALLSTLGKANEAFVQMDIMRLPLGILSGIGFIGGGAILRRGSLIAGVTTAATLWFITVIGLCFGGGQLTLGWSGTALGVFVLIGLRSLDRRIPREMLGVFSVHMDASGPTCEAVKARVLEDKMRVESLKVTEQPVIGRREYEWRLAWKASGTHHAETPSFVGAITRMPGVEFVKWDPQGGN